MPADIEHFHSFIDMDDERNKNKLANWVRRKVDDPDEAETVIVMLGLADDPE